MGFPRLDLSSTWFFVLLLCPASGESLAVQSAADRKERAEINQNKLASTKSNPPKSPRSCVFYCFLTLAWPEAVAAVEAVDSGAERDEEEAEEEEEGEEEGVEEEEEKAGAASVRARASRCSACGTRKAWGVISNSVRSASNWALASGTAPPPMPGII